MALLHPMSLKVNTNYLFQTSRISILGKWEEADGTSKEAAEKDPNFADTLINQVVVRFLNFRSIFKTKKFSNFYL